MIAVFQMKRDELQATLTHLSEILNRYAALYTNITGDFYVKDAYRRLRDKFGLAPENYNNEALQILKNDGSYTELIAGLKSASDRLEKVNKRIDAEKELATKGKNEIYKTVKEGLAGAFISWLIGFIFQWLWLGTFFFIIYVISSLRALDFDEHLKEAERLHEYLTRGYQKKEQKIAEVENGLWTEDFTRFCEQPENSLVITKARQETKEALAELKRLDLSDYNKFPERYQNNIAIYRALEIVNDGRASNWEKCSNVMAHEDRDKKHFENQDTMIKNQGIIIENQEKMLDQQEQIFDEIRYSNQQVEHLNQKIKDLSQNIEKHARKQERRLSIIAANQGIQIFQSERLHKKQLEQMQKSTEEIKHAIYTRPVQVYSTNYTTVENRRDYP